MTYDADPRVDAYIDALPQWQQEPCHELRDLIHTADPHHIITSGHDNKTARSISFHQGSPVPRKALTAMLRQIIANNRAGGWREIKAGG